MILFAKFLVIAAVFADVVAGTWNLKWFPSGRAKHNAPPSVEKATIESAGKAIRSSIGEMPSPPKDGDGTILFFQEIRDFKTATNLVNAIGLSNVNLACLSLFKDWDGRAIQQQCAIATTLPVIDSSWSYCKRPKKITPPRGYAYALLDGGKDGIVACFCVHLKSNYATTTKAKKEDAKKKREVCAEQLAKLAKSLKTPDGKKVSKVIIAGDFNIDKWDPILEDEKTHSILADASFANCFENVPLSGRWTYPGSTRRKDSTLDYIYHKGFDSASSLYVAPLKDFSDHRMVLLRLE
jgi:endonuclease/exonuclease/phosphatase family metal-dependent hydrolase